MFQPLIWFSFSEFTLRSSLKLRLAAEKSLRLLPSLCRSSRHNLQEEATRFWQFPWNSRVPPFHHSRFSQCFLLLSSNSTPCSKKKGNRKMICYVRYLRFRSGGFCLSIVDPQGFVDTVIENGQRNGKGLKFSAQVHPAHPPAPTHALRPAWRALNGEAASKEKEVWSTLPNCIVKDSWSRDGGWSK